MADDGALGEAEEDSHARARGVGLARDYVEKVTEFVEWWGEQQGA